MLKIRNSSDLGSGRRPLLKSDENSDVDTLVDEILKKNRSFKRDSIYTGNFYVEIKPDWKFSSQIIDSMSLSHQLNEFWVILGVLNTVFPWEEERRNCLEEVVGSGHGDQPLVIKVGSFVFKGL